MGDDWVAAFDAEQDASALLDERLASLLASSSGPLDWRSLRSTEAQTAWGALRSWVDWFRRELVFDHRVIPPCWYQHPALVSVLSALRDHWVGAYDSHNNPVGSSDWHAVVMKLEPRLREWASRTGCTVGAHRLDVIAEYPDDRAAWAAHVAADVAARAEQEKDPRHEWTHHDG